MTSMFLLLATLSLGAFALVQPLPKRAGPVVAIRLPVSNDI